MTDEIKTCDCKERALKKLGEFCFIAGAVFIGVLLAILLSASILKPKCPPPGMMGPYYPRIERQLPPPPMMHHRHAAKDFYRGPRGAHPAQMRYWRSRGDFEDRRGNYHNKMYKKYAEDKVPRTIEK